MVGIRLLTPRVFRLLLKVDQEIAEEVRSQGCPCCGGVLHSARYPRSPRGLPPGVAEEECCRFSFCCSRDGCRHRVTPASVRFLSSKHFVGAVVVLLSAVRQGTSPRAVRRLRDTLGVNERTLRRWCQWWRETVTKTPFWKLARGCFPIAVDHDEIPFQLLARFDTGQPVRDFGHLLRFLSPLGGAAPPSFALVEGRALA